MNSPSCQTTSQIRGVAISFPLFENMCLTSPLETNNSNRGHVLGLIDKARYSKRSAVCKMAFGLIIGVQSTDFSRDFSAVRSVPGAIATGVSARDLESGRRNPVATAPGTDLILLIA